MKLDESIGLFPPQSKFSETLITLLYKYIQEHCVELLQKRLGPAVTDLKDTSITQLEKRFKRVELRINFHPSAGIVCSELVISKTEQLGLERFQLLLAALWSKQRHQQEPGPPPEALDIVSVHLNYTDYFESKTDLASFIFEAR